MMKVNIKEQCVPIFDKLKMGKQLTYIIYNINQKEQIYVEHQGLPGTSYQEFVQKMPKDDLRYGIYDLEFDSKDGMHLNKIIFVLWSPQGTSPKRRMIFASSKDLFLKNINGIAKDIQAICYDDLSKETIIKDFGL